MHAKKDVGRAFLLPCAADKIDYIIENFGFYSDVEHLVCSGATFFLPSIFTEEILPYNSYTL